MDHRQVRRQHLLVFDGHDVVIDGGRVELAGIHALDLRQIAGVEKNIGQAQESIRGAAQGRSGTAQVARAARRACGGRQSKYASGVVN